MHKVPPYPKSLQFSIGTMACVVVKHSDDTFISLHASDRVVNTIAGKSLLLLKMLNLLGYTFKVASYDLSVTH